MLSFSHKLLDWRGPGLHALSFSLQATPPQPSASFSYTHTHTHKNTISVWLGQVQSFFSSDNCDFCLLTKTLKETRQVGIILHDSFFYSSLPHKDTLIYWTAHSTQRRNHVLVLMLMLMRLLLLLLLLLLMRGCSYSHIWSIEDTITLKSQRLDAWSSKSIPMLMTKCGNDFGQQLNVKCYCQRWHWYSRWEMKMY